MGNANSSTSKAVHDVFNRNINRFVNEASASQKTNSVTTASNTAVITATVTAGCHITQTNNVTNLLSSMQTLYKKNGTQLATTITNDLKQALKNSTDQSVGLGIGFNGNINNQNAETHVSNVIDNTFKEVLRLTNNSQSLTSAKNSLVFSGLCSGKDSSIAQTNDVVSSTLAKSVMDSVTTQLVQDGMLTKSSQDTDNATTQKVDWTAGLIALAVLVGVIIIGFVLTKIL